MSWCCTSNFSFAFNEGPVILTNFKRDFIFYKILHISFYQSLGFFGGFFFFSPRVVQAHTTYGVCLSASLSCDCELLMKLRGPQSLQRVPFDWVCTTCINSPPEIPKCFAPFAHCLKEKDSLGCQGELLEAQQQHCQPKVIVFFFANYWWGNRRCKIQGDLLSWKSCFCSAIAEWPSPLLLIM